MLTPLLACLSATPGLERELRLLPRLIHPGATCLDIGAARGAYSLPLAALVGRTGTVIAYEPRAIAAHRLARAASLLWLRNVEVEAVAVGAGERTGLLTTPRRGREVPGRSYLADTAVDDALDDGLRAGETVAVPVTTLDAIRRSLRTRIDFIKCDVEGAEYDVFAGGSGVLEGDRPVILCEIEARHTRRYGRTRSSVVELLGGEGYVPLVSPRLRKPERNHLFVPEERARSLGEITGRLVAGPLHPAGEGSHPAPLETVAAGGDSR